LSTFTLHLCGAGLYERVEDVTAFVGADASGSFGVLPGHAPLVTCLRFGLARYRRAGAGWRHLAVPGAVVRFADGALHLAARRYLEDDDPARLAAALEDVLLKEEAELHEVREALKHMEEAMLRRLWDLTRAGKAPA
jgi:F-type H+-transporting ATPase subunit epsilon